ncbi:hypothetical protein C4D60_Mb11t18770 [Musa balbisiana]|uniref:Uncharacterized protein n=1 Tax=Musa balbisiana TaxID=52838 RepID=A0A4S8J6R9_MUSBA|nr:hypothetical protein C4D60_Mb11t18770 [Musa balbisiana]
MAKDRDGSIPEEEKEVQERGDDGPHRGRHKKSKRKEETESEESSGGSGDDRVRSKKKRRRHRSSRRGHRRRGRASGSESDDSTSSDSYTESETDESGSESEPESDGEARKRRRKEKRRRERESEKERRRRKEREKERKRREEEKEAKRRRKKRKEKKKEKEGAKKGAVTNSWGKYGIIREIDMWNKRPEFTAWLSEVKQVNLETLSNWEEKQMFKEFMEDHNTATFPSKKYYDLDAYHRRKIEKAMKKGSKKFQEMERTVFDDEEQRRIELLRERERQKEEQVEALKRSMQSGMAQAMKEQSRLREEMMYQYKLGNFEAAAAIQKRLDPDVAM